jgi:hypothetical protein
LSMWARGCWFGPLLRNRGHPHTRSRSLKTGRVVIVLQGRYAGRKAVIVKTYDEGEGDRKFGHCVGASARARVRRWHARMTVAAARSCGD